jgi:crotonobetaine/carnitine-CoA ligase
VGEIVVRQPGMFRGYLGMPEATAELVHEGWIRTGDLGVLDARGYVSIVGRKKDVIRRSGENVSAAEVEGQLTAHPGVLAVAVVGVPDLDRGEELKAFVQPVAGADLDPAELVAFCAGRLAPHKVPRYVELVDEFPLTPSMRIRKELLRRRGDAAATAWDRESGAWGVDAR